MATGVEQRRLQEMSESLPKSSHKHGVYGKRHRNPFVRREATFAASRGRGKSLRKGKDSPFEESFHRAKTIGEIESTETEMKYPVSLPTTDDGRYSPKRGNPYTCTRNNRQAVTFAPFLQSLDAGPAHWRNSYPRRVRVDLNRKIVTHLRMHLTHRHEKRINQLLAGELNLESSSNSDSSPTRVQSRVQATPVDVFGSYTDFGDVIQKDRSKKKPMCTPFLPKIEQKPTCLETPIDAESKKEDSKDEGLCAEQEDTLAIRLEGKEDDEEVEEMNHDVSDDVIAVVSPVPTPRLTRPETRYTARLSYEEKVTRILQGKMDCRLLTSSKTMRIFVHSAGSDTEVERVALLKNVYPNLREFALARGYELQFIDPLWGMKGHVTDNQSDVEFTLRLLRQCKEEYEGLNFITFLAEKLDDPVLLPEIPVSEFESIIYQMEGEIKAQVAAIRLQLEAEKAKEKMTRENSSISENELVPVRQDGDQTEAKPEEQKVEVENQHRSPRKSFVRAVSNLGKGAVIVKALKNEVGLPDQPDPQLLRNWYQLDENAVPAVYKLAKVSTHYRDIFSNDVNRRTQARSSWVSVASRMQKMLYFYARRVLQDPSAWRKYNMSLSELVLDEGIFHSYTDTDEAVAWFHRRFQDVKEGDSTVEDFVTTDASQEGADRTVQALASGLTQRLPQSKHHQYKIPWQTRGINPTNREHSVYLERMCGDVTTAVKHAVNQFVLRNARHSENPLFNEVNIHVETCRARCRTFHGRKDLLQNIKEYVRSDLRQPLVVHGKSGCGRSSLMAKAAKDAHKWIRQNAQPSTLIRLIGITAGSTNVRMLLRSLCLQMCHVFGQTSAEVPHDYRSLVNFFSSAMLEATEETPLIIFLESLHKLTDENDGRKMMWLPRELPRHVKMVVSALDEDKYDCFKYLKKAFPSAKQNFLEVGPLPQRDIIAILEHWYSRTDRRITHGQYDVIVDCMSKCPQPLYLRVLFNESLSWPSWLKAGEIKIGSTVGSVAVVIFGRLERNYGEPLVRRALGYLTAAKNGVSRNEMEDLLSLDDAVMDDVFNHSKPLLRRLPPVYWHRLEDELGEYIQETESDGCVTLQWSHTQFKDAAEERYLNQRDKAPSYHKALAEYFRSKWYGVPKLFAAAEKGLDRHITAQPLLREANTRTPVFNLRRLSELPYHLLRSQQMDALKRECLCSFDFILAKISATSLRALFEDIQAALIEEPGDLDLKLLSDTLHLSASVLTVDARQLGSQIAGRLHSLIVGDQPVAPGDPVKYPCMKPLLQQAQKSPIPALIPSVTCLSPPGGILFDLLSGHTEPITAVTMTTDGQRALTSSKDNTLKLWELRTGRVTKTIIGIGESVTGMCTGANNSMVITSETDCIRVWSLKTGDCVHCLDQYEDPASLTTACDSQLLVAFFHGSNVMRVYRLSREFTMLQEINVTGGQNAIHKDNSIIVSPYSVGPLVLHGFKSASEAQVTNATSGQLVQTLKCKDSASVTALACNRDYFICAARYQYMKLHEIHCLELFDVRNGQYVRSIRGCISDDVEKLFVNQLGSHALAVCHSEASNVSNIAVWNIETEDHKHLAKHAKVSDFGACVDMRYVLTAARGDSTLRIWNLTGKVNQPVPKQKANEGTEQIIPMIDNPRYVVAKSLNNGPLTVWNVAKGKCSGNAVRIERGLLDQSDILLVRNTKVIILTDKNFPDVGESKRPVFQKILIYDLKQKKYVHKMMGCFIVPSMAHEYVLLDDEHLLGLSESRNHFVVWNLMTGQIALRLKPAFRQIQNKLSGLTVSGIESSRRSHAAVSRTTSFEKRAGSRAVLLDQLGTEEEKSHAEELKKKKDNAIEQFLISKDYSTIVASFYAHHLCVFDLDSHTHVQTLENPNSMLLLHVAALTPSGSHLVHANYDDATKTSYLTLWDCSGGFVRKRLRNEKNVCAVAVSENANCIVFGKTNKELRVWQPGTAVPLRRMRGHPDMNFGAESQIHILEDDTRAVVFAGNVSLWDLNTCCLLAVFTPDVNITSFTVAMAGKLFVFGMRDRSQLVTLKLMSREMASIQAQGQDMFGEASSSESEPDEEEDEETGSER